MTEVVKKAKRAALIAGERIYDVLIYPGTTAKDVLDQFNMSGFVLSKSDGTTLFGDKEEIFSKIKDGEKLHASPEANVGV